MHQRRPARPVKQAPNTLFSSLYLLQIKPTSAAILARDCLTIVLYVDNLKLTKQLAAHLPFSSANKDFKHELATLHRLYLYLTAVRH